MLLYLIPLALPISLIVIGPMLLPRIHIKHNYDVYTWGRNARNNGFRVEIAGKVQGSWIGVLAQEIFESHYKLKRGLIFVNKREMELMGHAVECIVANRYDNHDLEGYIQREAIVLTQYLRFKGETTGAIAAALHARLPQANSWAAKNRSLLDKWYARRPEGQ